MSKCYTSMDEIYKTILHCVQGWGSLVAPYFHTCLNNCLILLSEKEISFSVKANGNHSTYLCPIPEMNGDGKGFQFYFLFCSLTPIKYSVASFFIIISTTDRIASLTTCFFTAHIKRSRFSIIQRMKQMVFNFCILDCLIKFLRYFSFSQTLVVDFPFVSEFIFFLFCAKNVEYLEAFSFYLNEISLMSIDKI